MLRFAPETSAASSLERLPLGGQSLTALEEVAIRADARAHAGQQGLAGC
jgi:hypothetical protein